MNNPETRAAFETQNTKPKWQARMNNPETQATFDTQNTKPKWQARMNNPETRATFDTQNTKPKWQARMNNPETRAAFETQNTKRRQIKENTIQHRKLPRSLVVYVYFVDRCLSFCTFFLAIVLSVLLRYTNSDYSFGISKLFLKDEGHEPHHKRG